MKILITGSSGLIGSEAVRYFGLKGNEIFGIDNNLRKFFFGTNGDTSWNLLELKKMPINFTHYDVDIRDRVKINELVKKIKPDAIIHCAAQPSHDLAAKIPFEDFDTNAGGTLNLLEAARQYCLESPFVFLSTNKVYGDAPNEIELVEQEMRWEYKSNEFSHGINETMRIDQTKHSLFGASKTAADILTQEYGLYFNMPTVCFRGGCLTGPAHSSAELHGFLSYIVKCAVTNKHYTIFGYKGKQVRDQIHSNDVVMAIEQFIINPKIGAVYNLGGGKENSASILECISILENKHGYKLNFTLSDENRIGDHICYYSDLRKFKNDYPKWDITYTLGKIISEIVDAHEQKKS
ncbi:MAG: NAD-dependent epimerase/dehydratase family protein [Bacteroidia bacterium]|nr:NAD-dependent epimerase/dehydratase family protein [Bacteroidia bacterium]